MINYYLITKPGIVIGNLITVAAGFLLAAQGILQVPLFLATLLGLGLVMASACVFNNYIDRKIDMKMKRTQNRALVRGAISVPKAISFAVALGIGGHLILLAYTNVLAVVIAAIGFFVYVVIYSMWKSRTIYGTAIGSIAGAVPPLVGYCAVSHRFDMGALILFGILVLWQMPHFFSIAMYHFDDYSAANIPALPIKKGIFKTKQRMLVYILGFTLASILLTVFEYTGYFYLSIASILGVTWLWFCLKGFKCRDDRTWARNMFRMSLAIITIMCIVIPFDVI